MSYIGVDLDGTLAHHEPGQALHFVGAPILAMVERVRGWLARGQEVRVITARVARVYSDWREQEVMISEWCAGHLGRTLVVQDYKCGEMLELWDDRAVQVVRNEGVRADEQLQMELDYLRACADAREELIDYDRQHGIEGDACATLVPEQEDGYPICVDPVTGRTSDRFFVSSREALALAASLIRAASAAEWKFKKLAGISPLFAASASG